MPRFVGARSWDLFPCGMKICDFSQIRSSQLGAGSWWEIRIEWPLLYTHAPKTEREYHTTDVDNYHAALYFRVRFFMCGSGPKPYIHPIHSKSAAKLLVCIILIKLIAQTHPSELAIFELSSTKVRYCHLRLCEGRRKPLTTMSFLLSSTERP